MEYACRTNPAYSLCGHLRVREEAVPDNVPQVESSRGANHTAQYVYLDEEGLVK